MKPILFNTPMAKAIIEGKKTATRRIEKDINAKDFVKALCDTKKSVAETLAGLGFSAPYKPGDVLYVRESFRVTEIWTGSHDGCKVEYRAGGEVVFEEVVGKESNKWKPSIHQPKKLARTFLKVTNVYPDMLQDISEEQAEKEGCGKYSILVNEKTGKMKAVPDDVSGSFVTGFAETWNKVARGRQQKWICRDCSQEFFVQGTAPKFCCSCGSSNIGRAPSYELIVNFDEKEKVLRQICEELNPAYEQHIELKAKFDDVIAYWKQQKTRGYITKEQYDRYVGMFVGNEKKCP